MSRSSFATQSLADIAESAIAPAIIESCPTRIFLPNPRALEPTQSEAYRRFGLNDTQIRLIAEASPKREYYLQSRAGNRLFELGLGPIALAVAAASSPDDHKLIDRLLAEAEPQDFAECFCVNAASPGPPISCAPSMTPATRSAPSPTTDAWP